MSNTQRGGKCPVTPLTTLADIRGAMYSLRMKLYDCRTVKAFAQGTFISFVANELNRTAVANAFFIQWGCSHRCLPSVLRRCWLGGRKGIRPVKTEWWGAGVVICLERGADLHIAQLMPLPLTVSCFSKIQIDLPFWYWLTRVVPDKGPFSGRMHVYRQDSQCWLAPTVEN